MKLIYPIVVLLIITSCASPEPKDQWISLFNGKDLSGWTANENKGTFTVQEGLIVANGERSHLFYTGEVESHEFKNFEFRAEVKTTPGSNSGIYFHTSYQEEGWPFQGYEAQVNNTHIGEGDYRELKKTGSLYGVRNIYKQLVPENEWFHYYIKVENDHIQIKINDIPVINYLQPASQDSLAKARFKGIGTFALQGHDPHSTVYYRNIEVKPNPPNAKNMVPTNLMAMENDTYHGLQALMSKQHSFTDMRVELNPQFDLDQALAFYYRTGINLGIVLQGNQLKRVSEFRKLPVFVGIQAGTVADLAQFDYVIGSAGEYPDATGDAFMDAYVESIVADLTKNQINVWTGATRLPGPLEQSYLDLWTEERTTKVIGAAVANGVAIEIDNSTQFPPLTFIKQAKDLGAKFTYSGLGINSDMGELTYIFKAIEECSLDYKDIYIP